MKIENKLLKILMLFVLVTACTTVDDTVTPGSNLNVTPSSQFNELDKWINENFTEPYNIEIVYRWSESLVNQGRFLYPPLADSVRPALEIVKKLWIEPYNQVADTPFVQMISPRQLVLVGGLNVNPSGTITLGIADAGSRVTLFNIDLVEKDGVAKLRRFMQTIQHEYVHILNQSKPFDEAQYGQITPAGYTAQWFNESDAGSRMEGFISAYARANASEDFAEMVTQMLSRSRGEWDILVESIPDPRLDGKAVASIRAKEGIVVGYYKTELGLDLYELQDSVFQATRRLSF